MQKYSKFIGGNYLLPTSNNKNKTEYSTQDLTKQAVNPGSRQKDDVLKANHFKLSVQLSWIFL